MYTSKRILAALIIMCGTLHMVRCIGPSIEEGLEKLHPKVWLQSDHPDVNGAVGVKRYFTSDSAEWLGDVNGVLKVEDFEKCCEECEKQYPGSQIFTYSKHTKKCYCYKIIDGKQPVTKASSSHFCGVCVISLAPKLTDAPTTDGQVTTVAPTPTLNDTSATTNQVTTAELMLNDAPAPANQAKRRKQTCENTCSRRLQEVCGTDGETYLNKCHLYVASCNKNLAIFVKHEGRCRVSTEAPMLNDAPAPANQVTTEAPMLNDAPAPANQVSTEAPMLNDAPVPANQVTTEAPMLNDAPAPTNQVSTEAPMLNDAPAPANQVTTEALMLSDAPAPANQVTTEAPMLNDAPAPANQGCNGGNHGISCCPHLTPGDNSMGTEKFLQEFELGRAGCQKACQRIYPKSTGITESITHTYGNGQKKCWCEFGDPVLTKNLNYRTCLFPA